MVEAVLEASSAISDKVRAFDRVLLLLEMPHRFVLGRRCGSWIPELKALSLK